MKEASPAEWTSREWALGFMIWGSWFGVHERIKERRRPLVVAGLFQAGKSPADSHIRTRGQCQPRQCVFVDLVTAEDFRPIDNGLRSICIRRKEIPAP
jgi:hypothetical protein